MPAKVSQCLICRFVRAVTVTPGLEGDTITHSKSRIQELSDHLVLNRETKCRKNKVQKNGLRTTENKSRESQKQTLGPVILRYPTPEIPYVM